MLTRQKFIIAQIFLIIAASSFGCCIHPMMNIFFPTSVRSRRINFLFMLGLGIGGMFPSISGFIIEKTNFHYLPVIFISLIAFITASIIHIHQTYYFKPSKTLL